VNLIYFLCLPDTHNSVLKVSSFSIPSGYVLKEKIAGKSITLK
jgi:hypothetical protein